MLGDVQLCCQRNQLHPMNLASIDGPLSLSLSPSEGERVPSGQVRGFRDSKRDHLGEFSP
jgi:hypothetical protein